MAKLAQVGDFCPNEVCPDYGKLQSTQQHNIIKFGRTKRGRQRYKCKSCRKTFTESKGTLFYRRRTSEAEIIDTLAHIAEGNRISSVKRQLEIFLATIRNAHNFRLPHEKILPYCSLVL